MGIELSLVNIYIILYFIHLIFYPQRLLPARHHRLQMGYR